MKYNEQLTVTLEEDEFSQKQRLAYKLEQVSNIPGVIFSLLSDLM